ncbi:hypothetical protein [Spirosoma oryzicola]|uniref:hypothetical protein n=1 Tax=Spirosoma oryzicola TaxID=2898794 RepID=UPI001E57D93C|nr:hypothetical protein [Spirosoma oryzicola]UHG93380.1 hypothetical protein LQ777_10855 [Spirosoma oryzicola]
MTTTQQILGQPAGQPNAGFVRAAWLLRAADVAAVLSPQQYPVAGQPQTVSKAGLLVRNGALLSRLQLPAKTATFDEASSRELAGMTYVPTLQFPLPRPSAAFDDYIARYASARWVVFWADYNGQGWIAGDPANGLRLGVTRLQGATNGIQLTFTGRSAHPIWRLESTDPEVLFAGSAFDFGFNLSFDS